MLKHRVRSGLLFAAALVAVLVCLPASGVFLFLLAIASLAQWEFYQLLESGGYPACRVTGLLLGSAWIATSYLLPPLAAAPAAILRRWEMAGLGAAVCILLLRVLFDARQSRPVHTMAVTLLGFLYVPFLMSFFLRLAQWGGGRHQFMTREGLFLCFYVALTVKFSDVAAFATGTRLGRRRLLPRVSPAKSWEGLFGGLLAAAAVSVALVAVVRAWPRLLPAGLLLNWTLPQAALAGVGLGLVGVFGDLSESLFKRAVGAKDSGRIIPGMGGLLDVIDSLLFAPLAMDLYLLCAGSAA